MPRKPRQPTLDRVAAQAAQLTPSDQEELILILTGLREEEQNHSLAKEQSQVGDQLQVQDRDRYIELKYIPKPSGHKCGPYRYWRYYDNGKRRSIYLGKAEKP